MTVTDDRAPIISGVPPDQTIEFGDPMPTLNVAAVDFCDVNPVLETDRDSVPGACGGYAIVYRFTARDACNNRRTARYVLSVNNDAPPEIQGVTPGGTLSCGQALPAAPNVTATDSGGTPTLSMRIDTTDLHGGDTCIVVSRIWTATDDCGLTATAAQRFALLDGAGPVINGVPDDINVYCEILPTPPQINVDITATDDCGSTPEVTFGERSEQTNDGGCGDVNYRVIRSWTATDACGNVTTEEQIIYMKCECCSNGIDDDDDGLVDDYDPHCNCFAGVEAECDLTKRYYIPPVLYPRFENFNAPSELVITTLAPVANINIRTADGSYDRNFIVNQGTPLLIPLTEDDLMTSGHDVVERDKGFVITSDKLIQPIYRIDSKFNKILVTIKGPQALGRVFRAASQTYLCQDNVMDYEGHFISVMATEDNTEITLDFKFPTVDGLTGPVTRTLNRNETYLIRDDHQNTTVSGSLITSTKPIAVISGSQHSRACEFPRNGDEKAKGMDGGIDQLVPNCLTGDEYVLVRGKGNPGQQYAILVANKNNTRVIINGDPNNEVVLSAGDYEQVWLDGADYSAKHFKGNKAFYAFQVAGISTNNEVGMAICGPVGECKGDTLIEFPKFDFSPSGRSPENSVYVITPTAGLADLRLNGQPYSDCAVATTVPSRPDLSVVSFGDTCLQNNNSVRSSQRFTAGMLVGISRSSGTHGYLTSFKDRMEVYHPITGEISTSYFVDTICGMTSTSHCIDVQSCATSHTIGAAQVAHGSVTLDGGTCLTYTPAPGYHGMDEALITIQNDQGLFQTVCLRFYVCSNPPEITFPFIDTTVSCEAVPPIAEPLVVDECGMAVDSDVEETRTDGPCANEYQLVRRWIFWDECGDSTSAVQRINVIDTTAPMALDVPNDTVITSCAGIPAAPTLTFDENCDANFSWDLTESVVDSVCALSYTLVRVWEAWDDCGNRSTATQRIELRDTVGPMLSGVPADVELDCGDAVPTATVTVVDNCSPTPALDYQEITHTPACDTLLHLERRWSVIDECGRADSATQHIIRIDRTPPVVLSVPADTSIICGEPMPTDVPTFADDCAVPPAIVQVDSVVQDSCPVLERVYRTWSATDDCGKVTTARQIISVLDTVGPRFLPLPDTIYGSCADSIMLEPTIVEDCSLELSFSDSTAVGSLCNGERYIWRTFVARDGCGRESTYTQLYYFQDTVAPVWRNQPTDMTLNCGDPIPPVVDPSYVDACSGLNPIGVDVRDSSRLCPAARYEIRDYTVADYCGNLTYFRHTITIVGCEPVYPVLASGQAGCTGEDMVLQVLVDSGYTTPVYQWEVDRGSGFVPLGVPITDSTYLVTGASPADNGIYRVNVANSVPELSNPECSTLSNAFPLEVRPPRSSTEPISICKGDTLFYLGDTLTTTLTRVDSLLTHYGCDSIATLELTVETYVRESVDTTLCFGESLTAFGQVYDRSGTYADTVRMSNGCDSVLALQLTVLPDFRDTTRATICAGETYDFAGEPRSVTGTFADTLASVTGCDSTQTLLLTVLDTGYTAIDTIVCVGTVVSVAGENFDSTGIYTRVLTGANGCDSTVRLDLLVIDNDTTEVASVVCSGEEYFFGTQRITDAGVYVRTVTDSYGCDSTIRLTLSVSPVYDQDIRAELCEGEVYTNGRYTIATAGRWPMQFYTPDGCDSTVYVTLVYRRPVFSELDVTLCRDGTYNVFDTTYATAGTHVRMGTSSFGCDSTVTLNLTFSDSSRTLLRDTLCFGETFEAAGRSFISDTRDSFLLQSFYGCDSLVVVDVRFRENNTSTTDEIICFGDTLVFGGRNFVDSGAYAVLLTDMYGCDSLARLNLDIYPELRDTLDIGICAGEVYTVGGTDYDSTGIYTYVGTGATGCDSTVVLELTVRDTSRLRIEEAICDGATYDFEGRVLNAAGVYTSSYVSVEGCDSTIELRLAILPVYETLLDSLVCFGETVAFGGRTLTAAGTYVDTLSSVAGCDSTVQFTLNILDNPAVVDTAYICEGDSVTVDGQAYTSPGRYTSDYIDINGCDSTYTLQLYVYATKTRRDTIHLCPSDSVAFDGRFVDEPGTYSVTYDSEDGCDSVIVLEVMALDTFRRRREVSVCVGESYEFEGRTLRDSGVYTAAYRTTEGCDSVIELTLTVRPSFSLQTDTTVCPGTEIEFGSRILASAGTFTDSLFSVDGCDSVVTMRLSYYPNADAIDTVHVCEGGGVQVGDEFVTRSGRYTVDHMSYTGCDSTHTVQLFVHENVTRYDTARICFSDSVAFDGGYLSEPGTYVAEYDSKRGCDSTVVMEVILTGEILLAADDASLCAGSVVTLNARGYDGPVRWSPAEGLSCVDCPNPVASPMESTTYTVSATDCRGEVISATANVRVRQPLDVEIVSARKLRLGESARLRAVADDPNARIQWREGEQVLCEGCSEVEVRPTVTTVYEVRAETEQGCGDTERLTLIVEDACSFADIEIPNVISPNGDGANDLFEIRYAGIKEIFLLRIYNRWGELVYETEDIDDFWDGTHRGMPLNPGVFMYYMEGFCLNDEPFTDEGNVTLVR